MPICPICDDTGLRNSDSAHPEFCFCAAGKQARRQWDASHTGNTPRGQKQPRPASFIDIANLDDVNASVDAMRASLLGAAAANEPATPTKHAAVSLLYAVAHAGHEVSVYEATQLYELAKSLEEFLGGLGAIARANKR